MQLLRVAGSTSELHGQCRGCRHGLCPAHCVCQRAVPWRRGPDTLGVAQLLSASVRALSCEPAVVSATATQRRRPASAFGTLFKPTTSHCNCRLQALAAFCDLHNRRKCPLPMPANCKTRQLQPCQCSPALLLLLLYTAVELLEVTLLQALHA